MGLITKCIPISIVVLDLIGINSSLLQTLLVEYIVHCWCFALVAVLCIYKGNHVCTNLLMLRAR